MKKFKNLKTSNGFESKKLTREEMYRLSGGMTTVPVDPTKTRNPRTGIYDDDGCIPHPFPYPFPFPKPPIIVF